MKIPLSVELKLSPVLREYPDGPTKPVFEISLGNDVEVSVRSYDDDTGKIEVVSFKAQHAEGTIKETDPTKDDERVIAAVGTVPGVDINGIRVG